VLCVVPLFSCEGKMGVRAKVSRPVTEISVPKWLSAELTSDHHCIELMDHQSSFGRRWKMLSRFLENPLWCSFYNSSQSYRMITFFQFLYGRPIVQNLRWQSIIVSKCRHERTRLAAKCAWIQNILTNSLNDRRIVYVENFLVLSRETRRTSL
jgi:hypothetical protein